jgi:transcription antitermination factor NusG
MKRWFAIYTKPKSETKVVDQLKKMNIEVYCPMFTQIRQWSDRKKKVQVPLISSYVFVYLEDINRDCVFDAVGVVRYLFWLGKPAIIKEEEINTLKKCTNSTIDSVKIENLEPGDSLKLNSGVFKGHKGTVSQVGTNRLQLIIEGLGIKVTLTKNKVI